MFQQVVDFRDECDSLFAVLEPLDDADFETKTLFKDWTIHDVIAHLHIFNVAADLSITDESAFGEFWRDLQASMAEKGMLGATDAWLDGARNRAVFDLWRSYYQDMCTRIEDVDPKKRVKWAGPDMSVRSSVSARLMETWAHGQEVWDVLGKERVDADRIKNVAVLGMNTFGWTFKNRGLEIPSDVPYVKLAAPSGATWEWNEPNDANFVEGSATEFCQVVTQTRNIGDTNLRVVGDTATQWMAIAQCFAGRPEDPPPVGARHRRTT